jgi:serine/threonine protein kinase/tetratricopeptide (TPR) repeat protein
VSIARRYDPESEGVPPQQPGRPSPDGSSPDGSSPDGPSPDGPSPDGHARLAHWKRLDAALDALLDGDDADREAQLAALAVEDPAFAAELRTLLAADADASAAGFLTGTVLPPPVTSGTPGARCGPYELTALIGRGGMGSVWRAQRVDGQFTGDVAIKLLGSALLDPGSARRFQREGEILASLQHPNIGALRDAGVSDDGQPYLVLELVDGVPIDQWVRDARLDAQAIVRLLLQVLGAVSHAHAQLVVHRDLKPSNILVDATGRARLLDFGIAKLLTNGAAPDQRAATVLTRAGGRLLTPRYAAPEQLTGAPVSTATDVYALGVLLCELLTGALPYRLATETLSALESAIVKVPPVAPSELVSPSSSPSSASSVRQRTLRGDLDTIVLKALRKEPAGRYASVDALADDLTRWLEGRPVLARPASAGYRLRRFVQRHTLAVSMAAVVAFAVVGGSAAALWQAQAARAAQQRAESVTAFVSRIFTDADPTAGDGTALSGRELLLQAYGRLDEAFAGQRDDRLALELLIAQSLTSLQAYDDAMPILASIRAQTADAAGADATLPVRADLVATTIHRYQGALDSMSVTATRALTALRQRRQPDSALLVQALSDSVHLAIATGAGAQVVEQARVVLAMADAHFPAAHEAVVRAAQDYVVVLQVANAPADSLRVAAERALTLTRQRYADVPSHPAVIEGMLAYARALDANGRTRAAVALLDSAVMVDRAARPDAPLRRAFAFGNRGTYRRFLGDADGAVADFDSALTAFRAVGDTVGFSHAITIGNRAEALRMVGQPAAALIGFQESSAIIERDWSPEHPLAVLTQLRRAMALVAMGRLNAARAILDDVRTRELADRRPAEFAYATALLARRAGNPAAAIDAVDGVLAQLTDTSDHRVRRDRAPLLAQRALALAEHGERDAARRALDASLAAFRAADMDVTSDERAVQDALLTLPR